MQAQTFPIEEGAEVVSGPFANDALDLKEILVALRKKAMSYADALTQALEERKALSANLQSTQERCKELLLEGRDQRARIRELEALLEQAGLEVP